LKIQAYPEQDPKYTLAHNEISWQSLEIRADQICF
jgi:hypothetical protein